MLISKHLHSITRVAPLNPGGERLCNPLQGLFFSQVVWVTIGTSLVVAGSAVRRGKGLGAPGGAIWLLSWLLLLLLMVGQLQGADSLLASEGFFFPLSHKELG